MHFLGYKFVACRNIKVNLFFKTDILNVLCRQMLEWVMWCLDIGSVDLHRLTKQTWSFLHFVLVPIIKWLGVMEIPWKGSWLSVRGVFLLHYGIWSFCYAAIVYVDWSSTAKQFPLMLTRFVWSILTGKANGNLYLNNIKYPTKSSVSNFL